MVLNKIMHNKIKFKLSGHKKFSPKASSEKIEDICVYGQNIEEKQQYNTTHASEFSFRALSHTFKYIKYALVDIYVVGAYMRYA